jgi:hypothetical protein
MKTKNIFMALSLLAATCFTTNSCKEDIDESDLYTFTGEMMIDHFVNHPDTFSNYLTLLQQVHPSHRSSSTMYELLPERELVCELGNPAWLFLDGNCHRVTVRWIPR